MSELLHSEKFFYWCSEGCGFVDEDHRCEQWASLTYLSIELVRALLEMGFIHGATWAGKSPKSSEVAAKNKYYDEIKL